MINQFSSIVLDIFLVMEIPGSWIGSVVLILCTYFGYHAFQRYKKFQLFRELGIPGPNPHFIRGNLLHDMQNGTDRPVKTLLKWQKQYGNVFGYFRGTLPTVVVADLELIKQITIKDFANFTNRPSFATFFKMNANSLIGLQDETWKEVRRTLSPTFSASKMRQLTNIVNKTVSIFRDEINKHCETDSDFDIYDRFQRLTLDVIGECALALKIDCQNQRENTMYKAVRTFLSGSDNRGALSNLLRMAVYFPGLIHVMKYYYTNSAVFKMVTSIIQNLEAVIQKRRQDGGNKQKSIDILQLMLDAGHENDSKADEEIEEGEHIKRAAKKPLTDIQIVANCWIFILAGFETTATALSYTAHFLTVHQDIQEKVYQEIISKTDSENKIPTYEDAHNLHYLDQVINETLRLYPPVVLFMSRIAAHDYDMNGIKLPAGMKVEIPIYSIHHDPDLWPDPEKFDPERFSPENRSKIHPMAHIPFGAGPRNCIGMRFALLEAKLTLIRLIREYRLVPSSRTKDPPEVTVPHSIFIPKNGIYLKVQRRNV